MCIWVPAAASGTRRFFGPLYREPELQLPSPFLVISNGSSWEGAVTKKDSLAFGKIESFEDRKWTRTQDILR